MDYITYKKMNINDVPKLSEIDASIYIKNAWRDVEGIKKLVSIDYDEKGFSNGLEEHKKGLEHTILTHGYVVGAYNDQGLLVGFATLNRPIFGKSYRYVLLDQLFISKPFRKHGIGKTLMKLCMDEARLWGANKLYICAGSSEDSIAFYRSIGCSNAMEINQELYESDPRDFQLECEL